MYFPSQTFTIGRACMTIFLFIFFILLIAYYVLINYYRKAWKSIPLFIPAENAAVKVSIIVPLRNEEKNITALTGCLKTQDYPADLYEIIAVDDHSTDNTVAFLQKADIDIRLVQLPAGTEGKKRAIEAGIAAASGELIITTDGDCRMGKAWISTIASFYSSTGAAFIAAPVMIAPEKSLLSIFQSLDFLTLQGITGASVSKKFHSMCNGANLAYPKKIFYEVNGFEGIDNIPSGDDMLLMHKIFRNNPDRVYYLKNKEVIVRTSAEKSWSDFFNQRIRWASKAVHYRDRRIFYVLLLTYLVNVCFLLLAVTSFFSVYSSGFLLLFFAAKVLIEFPFVNAVAIFFGQQRLMKYFVFLQPLHIMYTVLAGWLGRFGSYKWKSRKIDNRMRNKLTPV